MNKTHLGASLEPQQANAVRMFAAQMTVDSGQTVTVSDVIRMALAEFMTKDARVSSTEQK